MDVLSSSSPPQSIPTATTTGSSTTGSSIVPGQGILADPEWHAESASIKWIPLPDELWVLIIQNLKGSKDLVSLSTTCQKARSLYQNNWVWPPDQRQFQALVDQLTTPALSAQLYAKVINKRQGQLAIPTPYTDEWKALRDTPPNSKLRGEARHAVLIKKMVISSWQGLLQPEVLADQALASQLMRLLIDLSPHLQYPEEYVEKLFDHGLEWETFEQLANVHLDRCIQLVAKYFPIKKGTPAYQFTDKQIGDPTITQQLLVSLKSGAQSSVLGYVVIYLGSDLMHRLLQRGCELEKVNFYGQTPLLQSAYNGDDDLLLPLLQQGANYHIKDKQDNTLLMALCTHDGPLTMVDWLLKQPDIDVNAHNIKGETALHNAARYAGARRIKALLNHPQLNINIKTVKGESAVDYAIKHGNFPALYFLLRQEKFDPILTQDPAVTALYVAIEQNRLTEIQQLLGSSTIKDQARLSAFNYAIRRGKGEIASLFLQSIDQSPCLFIEQAFTLARENCQRDVEEMLYQTYGEQHSLVLLPARKKSDEQNLAVEFREVSKIQSLRINNYYAHYYLSGEDYSTEEDDSTEEGE